MFRLYFLVPLCECKQLTHHYQIKLVVSELSTFISHPLVVVNREECAARLATEVFTLGKPCNTAFFQLSTATHNNHCVIVFERKISKYVIQDIFERQKEGEIQIISLSSGPEYESISIVI